MTASDLIRALKAHPRLGEFDWVQSQRNNTIIVPNTGTLLDDMIAFYATSVPDHDFPRVTFRLGVGNTDYLPLEEALQKIAFAIDRLSDTIH